MDAPKLIAVDATAKPWEDRFNEPTGKTMFRKELYYDPGSPIPYTFTTVLTACTCWRERL